jgi:putative transposase
MGRPPRHFPAGTIVHAYNRRVDRWPIFLSPGDYWAFIDLLQEGVALGLVVVFGYCIMPNHWHLVLRAEVDDGISKFMKWLTGTHAKRYRMCHRTVGHGHLYQDRFKSPVVEGEEHFLAVMRYVETNAARAALARFPDDWPWSSAYERRVQHRNILSVPPCPLPEDWGKQLIDYVAAWRGPKG